MGEGDLMNDEGGQRLTAEMSSRPVQVLAFVRDYITRWGQSPSIREIAAGVGIGKSHVRIIVLRLVKRGQLVRRGGPRGLGLPDIEDSAIETLGQLGWTIDRISKRAERTECNLPRGALLTYPDSDDAEEGQGRRTGSAPRAHRKRMGGAPSAPGCAGSRAAA